MRPTRFNRLCPSSVSPGSSRGRAMPPPDPSASPLFSRRGKAPRRAQEAGRHPAPCTVWTAGMSRRASPPSCKSPRFGTWRRQGRDSEFPDRRRRAGLSRPAAGSASRAQAPGGMRRSEQRAQALLAADDLLDADAIIAFDHDDLAAGDDAVVDDHLDRLNDAAVQFDDAAAGELDGVLQL